MKTQSIDLSKYPATWTEFIGQTQAVRELKLAITSARARKVALGHTILTAPPGIGKTSLATLAAREMVKGRPRSKWLLVQPPITWVDFAVLCDDLRDGDVLVVDEAHRLVEGGRKNSEWLLSYLQDGIIATARGFAEVPAVTIIAATTDPEKIPPAVMSRFNIQTQLEPYTEDEAAKIVQVTARSVLKGLHLPMPSPENARELAGASATNPRAIRRLLGTLRDLAITKEITHDGKGYDISLVLDFAGVTADGLDRTARAYLVALLDTFGGKAGQKAIAGLLPGQAEDAERTLLAKGFICRTTSGREITPAGIRRTSEIKAALEVAR